MTFRQLQITANRIVIAVAIGSFFLTIGCKKEPNSVSQSKRPQDNRKELLNPLVDPDSFGEKGFGSPFDVAPINQPTEDDKKTSIADQTISDELNTDGVSSNATFDSNSAIIIDQQHKIQSQRITLQAVELLNQKKATEAIEKFKEALEIDPYNHEAIFQLMIFYDKRGQQSVSSGNVDDGYADLIESGKYAQRLVDTQSAIILDKKNVVYIGNAFFNAACGHSRAGNNRDAIHSLQEAMKYGFDRPELMKTDSDLNPIRELPEFKALLERYKLNSVGN